MFQFQPPTNGFHGIGVLGRELMQIYNYHEQWWYSLFRLGDIWCDESSVTNMLYLRQLVQQFSNILMVDILVIMTPQYIKNKIRSVRIYNSSSGWSTMYAATEFSTIKYV